MDRPVIQRKANIHTLLKKKKGLVINEFEKLCQTEASLKRMVKEMHDIFDGIEDDINDIIDFEQVEQ